MTEEGGPDWQRVADGIRAKISSGEYEVGAPIPSTPKLEKQYGVSKTVVRQAVGQLKDGGVLYGHPGKGVYVKALPDIAAAGQRDLKTLGVEVADLARRVESIEGADLRATVERIEDNVSDLYAKLGYDYPRGEPGPRGPSGERAQQRREGTARDG